MTHSAAKISASATKRQYLQAAQQDQREQFELYRQRTTNEYLAEREGSLQLQFEAGDADWLVDDILRGLDHDLLETDRSKDRAR